MRLHIIALLASLKLGAGFSPTLIPGISFTLDRRTRSPRADDSSLYGVDVSGLPVDASSVESLAIRNLGLQDGDLGDIQNLLILASAAAYVVYEKRPLGSCNNDLVEIKESTIPGAGLGLFAKEIIPDGVVLGTFPGYVVDVDRALRAKRDEKARATAKRYM